MQADHPKHTTKSMARSIATIAVPLSLNLVVSQVMINTDAAFLGHLGTQELAGVALANMWMNVPYEFMYYGILTLNTLCSHAVGADNKVLAGTWLQTALVFAGVGVVPVAAWYMCVGHVIALSMDDAATVAFGSQFAHFMTITMVPQFAFCALTSYFATLDVVLPTTICCVFTMGLNVVFNQVLIHGVGGWPGLGFIGSPLATLASSVVQLTLYVLYTVVWKGYHRAHWGGWSRECVRGDRVRTFLGLAVPIGASMSVEWTASAVATSFLATQGPDIVATQAVLLSLYSILYAGYSGSSTATQILVSRFLGSGLAAQAKHVACVGAAFVLGLCGVLVTGIYLCRDEVVGVWSPEPVVLMMASSVYAEFALYLVANGIRYHLEECMYALNKGTVALVANNVGCWGVFLPLAYVSMMQLDWGLHGYWRAELCGEVVKIVLLVVFGYLRLDWHDEASKARTAAETTAVESPLSTPRATSMMMQMTPGSASETADDIDVPVYVV